MYYCVNNKQSESLLILALTLPMFLLTVVYTSYKVARKTQKNILCHLPQLIAHVKNQVYDTFANSD